VEGIAEDIAVGFAASPPKTAGMSARRRRPAD